MTKQGAKLRPHHAKPYRKWHISTLALSLLFVALIALQLGITVGRTQPAAMPPQQVTAAAPAVLVRSSFGYALNLDSAQYDISGTIVDQNGTAVTATNRQLQDNLAVSSVIITPKKGTAPRAEAASRLTVQVNPSQAALEQARTNRLNAGLPLGEIAAQLFPVSSTGQLDVSIVSTKDETLNGVPVRKTVYQYTPKFNGGVSYSVVWTGVSGGRAFAIKLQGLVGSSSVPATYTPVIASIKISGDQAVQGASIDLGKALAPKASAAEQKIVTERYLSDAYTPAVVKIYNITCGTLTFYGRSVTSNTCYGNTGSGYFMTKDGLIATNGHVVSYTAQDVFVEAITSDPVIFASYLTGFVGMSSSQASQVIAEPALLASAIAKVYDIPNDQLTFTNYQSALMVAAGSYAPNLEGLPESLNLTNFTKETASVRKAKLIAINYQAKDVYQVVADPERGFSGSDVAILKVNISNAPTITSSQGVVRQNEKILVAGFPGDADSVLTDNTSVNVSVTNGSVSSIRKAAGGRGNLYQSDADASRGNSGGPAINQNGEVIGLLTYRLGDGKEGNAPKSYIRDVGDVISIAQKSRLKLSPDSETRTAWERGLAAYAANRYSDALLDFKIVQRLYPAHRLVESYIYASEDAIAAGKDVKDPPFALLVTGFTIGLIAVGTMVYVIALHHGRHKVYKFHHATPATIV